MYIIKAMPKTLVDIDPDLLEEAKKVIGTKTIKDTVNGAIAEIVLRARRRDFIEWLKSDPLPDARDPEVMKQAWR